MIIEGRVEDISELHAEAQIVSFYLPIPLLLEKTKSRRQSLLKEISTYIGCHFSMRQSEAAVEGSQTSL